MGAKFLFYLFNLSIINIQSAQKSNKRETLVALTVEWRSRRISKCFAGRFECVIRIATTPSGSCEYCN